MISPRAILRNHRVAPLPRVRAPRRPVLARWWRHLDPVHIAWLLVWSPWWVGNELPPPPHPRSREAGMAEQSEGSAGDWLLETLDDLKLRFGLAWAAALLLRGAWLGGVAGIVWLALSLLGEAPAPSTRQLAILVAIGMALGLALRLFHRPRYLAIALLMERAFDLRSRLSTAVTALRLGAPRAGSLHSLQLADAANMLDRARRELRPVHWVPVREVFIAFIVAMTLLLLLVTQRPEGDIPAVTRTGVPAFVPVSERLAAAEQQAPPPELPDAASLQEVEDLSRTSNQARQDLEAIAGALEGNQVTAPAASAIASEDYPGANEQLDEASERVSQLPQNEREALADELDEAADQVSEDNPELADAARDASDEVRAGEDTGALDDLGDEIEQTGESVISQQASGGQMSESEAGQQGDPQSGAPGGASQPGDQPQPGQQGAGEPQGVTQGDPGSGMDASAGVEGAGEGDQSSESGAAQGSEGQGSGNPGEAGDPAQGDPTGGSGQPESGESPGNTSDSGGDIQGSPNEEGESSQGSGAGTGQTDANDPTEEGGTGGGGDLDNEEQAPEAGQGEAGDPPPGGQDEGGEEGQPSTAGGSSSIQLPGTSGERVRSGSDVGASSVGSGGGVGAASGDSTGDVSGSTGPDPNSVPEEWRTIVEDYFREGGAP